MHHLILAQHPSIIWGTWFSSSTPLTSHLFAQQKLWLSTVWWMTCARRELKFWAFPQIRCTRTWPTDAWSLPREATSNWAGWQMFRVLELTFWSCSWNILRETQSHTGACASCITADNMLLTPVDYQKFAVSTCSRPIQVFVFPLWEGIGKIKFPLLSDFKKEASEAYDVLADDGSSHRGLFLIDKLLGRMDRIFSERSGMCIWYSMILNLLTYFLCWKTIASGLSGTWNGGTHLHKQYSMPD